MTDWSDVHLRPLRDGDLDRLEAMFRDPEQTGEYAWYGFGTAAALRRRIAEDGALGPNGGFLAIEAGSEWCGFLTWYPQYYGGAAGSQAWRFGFALVPAARGHGVGTATMRLLTDYLFQHTPLHRIESCVDPDNTASRAMLERVGYAYEGRLRQAEFRAGRWRDLLIYSRLREDG